MQFQFINKQVEVRAHGDINPFDISNSDFTRAVAMAEDKKCNLFIDLHSFGGSVIEGNLIYNTLSNTKVKKLVDITGIAASMATVIMLPADRRRMNDDSFIMLHRPVSYVEGDEDVMLETAKILTSMRGTMAKRYAEISGKTIDEVNALWLNGKDNWMDAAEAKESGLIDEIIVTGRAPISKAEVLANTKNVFEKFTARLAVSEPNTLKETSMKKDLIASLKLEGVTEASSDVEIIEAIKKQRTEQDATIKELQEKAEADKEKNIDDLLEEYVTAEAIKKDQTAAYKEVGKALGIDKMKAMLPVLKKPAQQAVPLAALVKTAPAAGAAAAVNVSADGELPISSETWDALAKKSGELESVKKNRPEVFQALYKAKYGVEPKL
ncbi:ATP-dependent Clp protease proteolytic subunit [Flavobacterium endoglycinae]|uniref:ATP-dependent Clp protease proteolytic subunit n=1 Tax=Flavobacterium endoglycinae TaxID=2816357 RepID=A0ABX7QJG1_9FLAO|nr:Clp protease ClpP [Flavobacterium endoglycinae]QSW90708.1 ATP-dependent Clp protease proteolytic subunit [Flavobacterium endoglycinae]